MKRPPSNETLQEKMAKVAEKARALLKERGMTDAEIDAKIKKRPKRPRDPAQLAKLMIDIATGQPSTKKKAPQKVSPKKKG